MSVFILFIPEAPEEILFTLKLNKAVSTYLSIV